MEVFEEKLVENRECSCILPHVGALRESSGRGNGSDSHQDVP